MEKNRESFPSSLQALLAEGAEDLKLAGIGEWELDARLLLLEAFQLNMAVFLADRNRPLDLKNEGVVKSCSRYRSWIRSRSQRIPLQHLTGTQEFMGLEFMVNEHVLIPRQDTETLVELVLSRHADKENHVLDICTGSGCIGISLAALGKYEKVVAADISKEALKAAGENARRLLDGGEDRKFVLKESDLTSEITGCFDIIVSNPPYIASSEIEKLEPEVRDHEPRLALDGTEDGLFFYRRLCLECREHLKPGGAIYFEIGYDQGEAVKKLLSDAGYDRIEIIKDAPGKDRVAAAIWPEG